MKSPGNSRDLHGGRPHPLIDVLRIRAMDRLHHQIPAKQPSLSSREDGFDLTALLSADGRRSGPAKTDSAGQQAGQTVMALDCSDDAIRRPVGKIVVRLMSDLTDQPESCRNLMGKLDLVFSGLSTGLRPFDSEPLKQHFARIHSQWPYWIHFLNPTRENLATLLLMLSDPVRPVRKGYSRAEISLDETLQRVDRMFAACAHAQAFGQCTSIDRRLHISQVLEVLGRCLSN